MDREKRHLQNNLGLLMKFLAITNLPETLTKVNSKGLITRQISSRAEISAWLLKQILLKSNCRLHGEGFSLGKKS